ncbi:apoptosis facilitator Bcl-2-like protein 14 [Myxocyprinus asiaticus]|uniref:apoptosis facilitator Bcl-2-like protein 14 n=1 Tax=Myxocyprinus asiaticus TaxID=70543 RepID=UPI0022216C6B|nr:apoptosis facilitator Bcl-2-like protein 14 [Myxocyprinus asiaticus]
MDEEQSNGDVQVPASDCLEYKLLIAYTRKRRPTDTRLQKNRTESKTCTHEAPEDHNQLQKRKKKRKLPVFLKCFKPSRNEDDHYLRQPATIEVSDDKVDDMEEMASKLTDISNSVHFTPCELESDYDVDRDGEDIVQKIVELLREHGDKLDEKIKADKALSQALQSSLTYSFFKKVMDTFFRRVTPEELPPQEEKENTEVALICEATNQLFGVDHHPMNRVLGFGAKYLQDKFPTWINRNTGNVDVDESNEEVH